MASIEERFRAAARTHSHDFHDLRGYRGIGFTSGDVVNESIDDFAAWLRMGFPPGTLLVLYSRSEEGLDVFAVGGRSRAFEHVHHGIEIASRACEQLLRGLGVRTAQAARAPRKRDVVGVDTGHDTLTSRGATETALRTLSETLFPENIRRALEREPVSHLVIVPTGGLGTVPYAMLEVPPWGQLVDGVSTTIAPSLGDVMSTARPARGRPGGARTFAHPVVVGNPRFSDPEYVLQDLPGAEREAKEIGRLLHATPLLGAEATKARVARASQQADLVYLATHGVADAENPLDGSFLALAASGESDARWTAREIQHAKLPAELVVLSACQTGLGGTLDAGVTGLARAFQLAGAQQVVMTLWSIDDVATESIMKDVMIAFLRGESVPQAVRLASMAARDEGLTSSSWAPFVTFAGPFPWRP